MEISEFLDRKLSRRFKTFDQNRDGYIERDDFVIPVDRLASEFGLSADDERVSRLRALSIRLWEHLATVADVEHTGRITEAEYKDAFARGLLETPESFEAGYRPFLEAIMAIADHDADGKLALDEQIRWTVAFMALSENDPRETHRRLDSDGDGYITTDDLLDGIRGFYFDEGPDSPGSWMMVELDD